MKTVSTLVRDLEQSLSTRIEYPANLLVKFDESKSLDREVRGHLVDGGVAERYYQWLTLLARQSGARTIVELGNRHGTSTVALYHGLQPDQTLYTIDVVKDQRYVPDVVFKDPRVRFVWGDALDLTAYELAGFQTPFDIDILWTDTIHFYKQLKAEYRIYEPLLADEALIVIDDIHLNDKGRFFQESSFEKFDLTALCHSSGFGALHYIRPAEQRGRSKEERLLEALKRSAHQGYDNFWDLYEMHKALEERIQFNPFLKWPLKLAAKIRRELDR
jgi:predicted O-methyltransferase YrrM